MVLAGMRRFAWLLVLALVTGLTVPTLASAMPCDATPITMTHRHTDGTVHNHLVKAGYGRVNAASRNTAISPHCPGCMNDAACTMSCVGLAVLPHIAKLATFLSAATWSPVALLVRPGVGPADEIEPPRTILSS